MAEHLCRRDSVCRCRMDGDSPADDCPIHSGVPDDRCGTCGRFLPRHEQKPVDFAAVAKRFGVDYNEAIIADWPYRVFDDGQTMGPILCYCDNQATAERIAALLEADTAKVGGNDPVERTEPAR
jgi:hypothetical protein